MVQTLNKDHAKRIIFYQILHQIKMSESLFYYFLNGGAGVGKLHLTKALYQAALEYNNTKAGDDFHQIKVLLSGPAGKAAYIVKGHIIHSAIAVPANQSLKKLKIA